MQATEKAIEDAKTNNNINELARLLFEDNLPENFDLKTQETKNFMSGQEHASEYFGNRLKEILKNEKLKE